MSVWLVALAPLALAGVIAGFRNPMRILLPAYAVLVPFGSGLSIGVDSKFGSVSSLLGILLGAALLVRLLTEGGHVRLPPALPVWILFLGLAGASVLWSIAPRLTEENWQVLASLVVLYALLTVSKIDRTALTRTENALLIGGLVAVSYGLAQLLFLGGLPAGEQGGPRFGRDLLGPNITAASLLLPFAIALGRASARGAPERSRVFGTLAAAALLIGVVLTGSRGGLLAAIVTFLAVTWFTPRAERKVLVRYGAAGLAILAFILTTNPFGLGERQTAQRDSSGRTEIWEVGVAGCEKYCMLGAGWGTFPQVYAEQQPLVPEARVLRRGTHYEPHNIWMLAAVEAGIAGALLMTVGFGLVLYDAFRLPSRIRAPLLGAILGIFFAGFFLSNLEFKFVWLAMAYVTLSRNVLDAQETGAALDAASTAK